MKKHNLWHKIQGILVAFMIMVAYIGPSHNVWANTALKITILDESINEGKLQPGDSFSVSLRVQVEGHSGNTEDKVYFDEAQVGGSVSTTSKPYLDGEDIKGDGVYTAQVSGLIYSGVGNQAAISIKCTDAKSGQIYTASTEVAITGYTQQDFQEQVVVEKQGNLVVKNDQTQTVEVKVTNKGNVTINQAEAKLSLDSKVAGVTIKSDTYSVKNIKSKEVKTAQFTIAVDAEAKAGVYPATVTLLGQSYPVNIQVDSTVVPSSIEVSVENQEVFTPGTQQSVHFTLKNVGDRDAKNIRFEVVNTENIAIVENSNVRRINLLQGKSNTTITMNVRVSSQYKGDSVALPIKLTYLSSTGEEAEDTQYVYLYTYQNTAASEVIISNVISPTQTYGIDENFTVKFNVSSTQGAENVQVSVEGDEGIVPKSQNLFFINKLGKGESKQYSVNFAATRTAESSSHPIKITVTYGSGESATTINQYGSVNVHNPDKDEKEEDDEKLKGKPKVIIGSYEINPTIVQAGEEFILTMGFLNTSNKHTVHNLKANILPVQQDGANKAEDTGNVFTPVDGSNTIFIADLATGEMATKELHMYTIPSATAKTYQITVQMAYEDEEGNEIEATETLGIPVEQVTKIEVGDVYVDAGTVGMETAFSVTFYNRGRTNISNMMVYIKGEGFDVQENRTFIGNFEIGASEAYEPMIIPNMAGTLKGTLVVEYEDPSGKEQILEHEFEFAAEEMWIDDSWGDESGMMPDMNNGEEESSNKRLVYVGIGVGVVIALILAIIVLKKRKAKKEAVLFDEED